MGREVSATGGGGPEVTKATRHECGACGLSAAWPMVVWSKTEKAYRCANEAMCKRRQRVAERVRRDRERAAAGQR